MPDSTGADGRDCDFRQMRFLGIPEEALRASATRGEHSRRPYSRDQEAKDAGLEDEQLTSTGRHDLWGSSQIILGQERPAHVPEMDSA